MSIMTLEESRELLSFVERHKDEVGPMLFRIAENAQRQIEYYYLDGQSSMGYDKYFYCWILNQVAWSLMYDGPMHCDGYTYPDDAPKALTSKLL
jgi:hypothetical protein